MSEFSKYGKRWPDGTPDLKIEFSMIRKGDVWLKSQGRSLFFHFKEAIKLIWPKDDHHRWTDLILQTYCENDVSVFLGCSDSTKSWTMSKIVLVDYWAAPDQTLSLVSTTEGRGAELRIWGAIKDLFNQGRERHDWLEGNPVDYLKTITTESVDDERREARSLRRGIIVVPCKTGGLVSGLAPYIGIKAPRLRHCGDELQAMSDAFLNAYSNWYGKSDFKGMMAGNFMQTDDPLGIASEPVDGWDTYVDTQKTQTWKGRFYGAAVVALDGRDSPNFDEPMVNGRPKYPYLIGAKKLNAVRETHGEDSWQWWTMCVGKPVKGMDIWRVINRDFCRKHGASEDVTWKDTVLGLYSLDPAYGGGDLCVGRRYEMGIDIRGKQMLWCGAPEIIPIKLTNEKDAEEQIAEYVYHRLNQLGIKPENCGYDSFGRGTLGNAFAKLFGSVCPVPIDSSAQASGRPVRFDLFVEDSNGGKRLKRADEHYRKAVTEYWFSVREAIESGQIRGLDKETISEGCARKFTRNRDNKLEIEPKEDYKERCQGRSPDRFDNLAIGVEIARQRGFRIENLAAKVEQKKGPDWLDKQVKGYESLLKSKQLQAA